MLPSWQEAFSRQQRLSQGLQDKPAHAVANSASQLWVDWDVSTERTSQEMLLDIFIGNNELSGKENLLKFVENQNYYKST